MRYVVIGAGTAGLNAVRTLRQSGCQGEITLVSAERPYSRMVLPYLLSGAISEARTATASDTQLAAWQVKTRFGVPAKALDTTSRHLVLADESQIPFDALLIATGSRAARPSALQVENPHIHTFWTLTDAQRAVASLQPGGRSVLVGAGFIAFTILSAVWEQSQHTTLIEAAPRILPRMVDAPAAALVTAWLESQGIEVRTGASLQSVVEGATERLLRWSRAGESSLQTTPADAVIAATGIRPNLDWLATETPARGAVGLKVDAHLETSVPGIFAAGDVAEGPDRIDGGMRVQAIETAAQEHGRIAARNMLAFAAGTPKLRYAGAMAMNIVSAAGLDVASFGHWDAEPSDANEDVLSDLAEDRFAYRKYLFDGERMIGGIIVSPAESTWSENEVGMLKGLVHSGRPLGPWKAYLRASPFDLKTPFLALGTTGTLLPETVLDAPTPSPWEKMGNAG